MTNDPHEPCPAVRVLLRVLVSLLLVVTVRNTVDFDIASAHTPPATPSHRPTDLPTATIHFASDAYSGYVGAPIVMPLLVQDAGQLAGWQVVLTFDPTQLQITDVTPGDFLPGPGRTLTPLAPWTVSLGHLAIGGYTIGPPPGVSGAGVLAYVTITPQAVGDFSLDLADAMLISLDDAATVQLQPNLTSGVTIHASVPTAVTLASFQAIAQLDGILVTWETVSEIGNLGFNLYRSTTPVAPETLLAFVPSPAPGSSQGFTYEWLDTDVTTGQTYYYWLEDVPTTGSGSLHGPVSATYQTPTAVTVTYVAADTQSSQANHRWTLAVAAAIALGGMVYLLWRKYRWSTEYGVGSTEYGVGSTE